MAARVRFYYGSLYHRNMKNDPERSRARAAQWAKDNKERRQEYARNYYQENKERYKEQERARKAADPEKYRLKDQQYRMKSKYGITPEQFQEMYDKQEGRCALCRKHESEIKGGLHIDHCHETGVIRGFLCGHCNKALGLLFDNQEVIERINPYLNQFFVDPKVINPDFIPNKNIH